MHKSKVTQNPKICIKPLRFFDLIILCALKVHFWILRFFKDIKSQFSKANLGYLGTFLMGMLESKFALNNLNFKCYIQVFFIAFIGHIKSVGTFCPLPPTGIYVWPKVQAFRVKWNILCILTISIITGSVITKRGETVIIQTRRRIQLINYSTTAGSTLEGFPYLFTYTYI